MEHDATSVLDRYLGGCGYIPPSADDCQTIWSELHTRFGGDDEIKPQAPVEHQKERMERNAIAGTKDFGTFTCEHCKETCRRTGARQTYCPKGGCKEARIKAGKARLKNRNKSRRDAGCLHPRLTTSGMTIHGTRRMRCLVCGGYPKREKVAK